MKDNFEAFEIIIQRPDKKLTVKNAVCPFCSSSNFANEGGRSTLLGIDKMNHKWSYRKCNDCGKNYTVECKNGNVWITDKECNVLKGMPSCFEHYVYDCKCGGKVKRKYTDMDGNKTSFLSQSNETGKWIKHYKTFFECDSCGKSVQTESDHYCTH